MPLIEAVPNVSEGQNTAVLHALENCLRAAPGVRLLGLDTNPSANRSVFTLLGQPENVAQALFDFIALACRLIDMRKQRGAHPRLGAVDVCPLVPLEGISLEECARLARGLGRRVGLELGVPVYLYEAAAETPQRKNLAFIRRGEYENLAQKLWKVEICKPNKLTSGNKFSVLSFISLTILLCSFSITSVSVSLKLTNPDNVIIPKPCFRNTFVSSPFSPFMTACSDTEYPKKSLPLYAFDTTTFRDGLIAPFTSSS